MKFSTVSVLGCGWLGFPLAKELIHRGYVVKGTTTRLDKISLLRSSGIQAHHLVIEDQITGSISGFFDSDILILNIPPGRRRANVEEMYPQQIEKVLTYCRQGTVRRLIFVSSTSVYGKSPRLVTEDSVVAPETASGRGLVMAERHVMEDTALIGKTVLRMAGLIGPDRNPARFLAGKSNLNDPDAPVNLVHLTDCIEVITKVIRGNHWNEVFNVCSDEHPGRKTYYTKKAIESNLSPPLFTSESGGEGKIISNEKVKRVLGHTFRNL